MIEKLNSEQSLGISPRFVTKGGRIHLSLPFDVDPFLYHPSDFLVDAFPIRKVYMSHRIFYGEISPILESKDHILAVRDHCSKETHRFLLQMPELVVGNFHQLESDVFLDQSGNLIFLDIQKSSRKENRYIPTLIRYNLQTDETIAKALPDRSINSIFVDAQDRIFATSMQEKTLFEIDEKFHLIPYARGVGAPFGMAANRDNELFMADQKGSLFKIADHRAIYLCDIPSSLKGYYLAVCPHTQDIFISIPSYPGENAILSFNLKTRAFTNQRTTYNLVGSIGFDAKQNFYWIENTREESILYRRGKDRSIEKIVSGYFFTGLVFDSKGDLYINDLHTIYKISGDKLDD